DLALRTVRERQLQVVRLVGYDLPALVLAIPDCGHLACGDPERLEGANRSAVAVEDLDDQGSRAGGMSSNRLFLAERRIEERRRDRHVREDGAPGCGCLAKGRQCR